MIIARFDDTEYPKSYIDHIRHTIRIILRTQNDTYVFLKIKGSDDFGERNHIETIGGGMENNESFDDTIKREVKEETGYSLLSYDYIGTIIDRYYLIHRETHSHFFEGYIDTSKKDEVHLTELEKTLFDGLIELSYDEAIKELNNPTGRVAKLIYQRDLFALLNKK